MRCFHGMTEKAYKQWATTDSKPTNVISPWTVSDNDGFTYLHTIDHAMIECSTDDIDEAKHFAISQAKESAFIQAAVNNDNCVYVIEMELPDELLETDVSCENMDFCKCIDSGTFNRYKEKAIIHCFPVNPMLHIFRIAGLINNNYFNKYELPDEIVEAAKIVSKVDCSSIYEHLY
jgi:hypothetical protein